MARKRMVRYRVKRTVHRLYGDTWECQYLVYWERLQWPYSRIVWIKVAIGVRWTTLVVRQQPISLSGLPHASSALWPAV